MSENSRNFIMNLLDIATYFGQAGYITTIVTIYIICKIVVAMLVVLNMRNANNTI